MSLRKFLISFGTIHGMIVIIVGCLLLYGVGIKFSMLPLWFKIVGGMCSGTTMAIGVLCIKDRWNHVKFMAKHEAFMEEHRAFLEEIGIEEKK